MYYEIYLDVVFLINLMFEFVILRLTGSVLRRKSTLLRSFLAAFTGSLLLCIALVLRDFKVLRNPFIGVFICNFFMVFIAFYRKKEKLYIVAGLMLALFVVTSLFGGILNAVYVYANVGCYWNTFICFAKGTYVSWQFVCIGAVMCFVVLKVLFQIFHRVKDNSSIYWEVTVYIAGNKKNITALADTGNQLREPISGKPVHVIEMEEISDALEEDFLDAVKKYYKIGIIDEGLYRKKGIRMIPFRAVGTPNEKLLVGISVDKLKFKNHTIEYETERPYVALYDAPLAQDGSYHMLLHGSEMRRN